MDYSIFKALNFNMGGIEAALICYDVMCQWSVHMKARVQRSGHLKIPDGLELRLGIGLFHIHGHQDSCLPRYCRDSLLYEQWATTRDLSWMRLMKSRRCVMVMRSKLRRTKATMWEGSSVMGVDKRIV